MTQATVDEILALIEGLSETERAILQRRLDERLENEWQEEAAAAREDALQRGIDQATIDEAIHRRRYGA